MCSRPGTPSRHERTPPFTRSEADKASAWPQVAKQVTLGDLQISSVPLSPQAPLPLAGHQTQVQHAWTKTTIRTVLLQLDAIPPPCSMKPDDKARVRRFAPKTRNGCLTCKRRHTRCDERKPACSTCERLGLKCMGYVIPKTWIFEPSANNSTTDTTPESSDTSTATKADSSQSIPLSLVSTVNEPAVVMQAYFKLATSCPMAWDSALYLPDQHNLALTISNTGVIGSALPGDALPGPLRYHSYIALATSVLAHFEPRQYPLQLHLKYLHFAVAEMRQLIAHASFELEDLLHGISKTLLASVIQGDFDSARAHLGAAASIVSQQGGMHAIDGQIAATLRYADFQLAVESLRAPAFPLFASPRSELGIDVLVVDPELVRLATELRADAKSSREPRLAAIAIMRLLDSTIVLTHAFGTSNTKAVSLEILTWVLTHTAETMYLLLNSCPSVLQRHASLAGGYESLSASSRVHEWIIIILMWCQLLICLGNETISTVSIRMNSVPILHHNVPFANTIRAGLSKTVRDGLQHWNNCVAHARREWKEEVIGDWVRLVDIAAETEKAQSIILAPFMQRLLAIKDYRSDRPVTDPVSQGSVCSIRMAKADRVSFDASTYAQSSSLILPMHANTTGGLVDEEM